MEIEGTPFNFETFGGDEVLWWILKNGELLFILL